MMKKIKQSYVFILLVLFFVGCAETAKRDIATKGPFDEIYGDSGRKKQVREVYKGIIDSYNRMSVSDKKAFYERSMKDFEGDNALHPLPRILAEAEYDFLNRGVVQRGNAIKAFLKDHYSGKKEYAKKGIIPASIIDKIIQRHHEHLWAGKINTNTVNFWYGPDIIRGPPDENHPEGRFLVVEDNPGFIGGIGDLVQAKKTLLKLDRSLQKKTNSPDPQKFYDDLVKAYKQRAKEYGGIPVVILYVSELAADNEDKRIRDLFQNEGIKVVRFNPYNQKGFDDKEKIIVEKNGAYLYTEKNGKKSKTKVGYIVANMDPHDLEFSHPANRPKRIMAKAAGVLELEMEEIDKGFKDELMTLMKGNPKTGKIDYEKIAKFIDDETLAKVDNNKEWGMRGLADAVFANKVGMTNSPGMDFIGDKEFYIYMEDIIRFYLKEEPILKNMETGSFRKFNKNGDAILDRQAVEKVVDNFDDYVVKGVDGRGGDAVWVGPKVSQKERERVMDLVRKNPGHYIFQRYNALSTMGDYISDLRLHSDVSNKEVIVANVPWSRVVGKNGDGKVNISANGYEATVLIHRMLSNPCKVLMNGFFK